MQRPTTDHLIQNQRISFGDANHQPGANCAGSRPTRGALTPNRPISSAKANHAPGTQSSVHQRPFSARCEPGVVRSATLHGGACPRGRRVGSRVGTSALVLRSLSVVTATSDAWVRRGPHSGPDASSFASAQGGPPVGRIEARRPARPRATKEGPAPCRCGARVGRRLSAGTAPRPAAATGLPLGSWPRNRHPDGGGL